MSRTKLDCPICTESRLVSKTVACPHCRYAACVACYQHVILDSINEPMCINPDCKRPFTYDFVQASFPKTWLSKEYRQHRETLLHSREKAFLPAAQAVVERRKHQSELLSQMQTLRNEMTAMKLQIADLENQWRFLENGGQLSDEKESSKREFICPCPDNQCRGSLSARYKCGTCGLVACSDCRERKEEEHKCNPDTVASVDELKKSCRSCPSCMTPIFRISGCDQMFCVKDGCHTAFNWRTGKIETGIIHNPHYFEWQRSQQGAVPRNPHEVQCGGLPHYRNVLRKEFAIEIESIARFGVRHTNALKFLETVYRSVNHLRDVVMRRLPTRVDNVNNMDLRVAYLEQTISEEEWKVKLQRREKERAKQLDQRDILEVYCNVVQDLFLHLVEDGDVVAFLRGEQQITEYSKEAFCGISRRYHCVDLSPWRYDNEIE